MSKRIEFTDKEIDMIKEDCKNTCRHTTSDIHDKGDYDGQHPKHNKEDARS